MKKKVIYLSGPISGIAENNFTEFALAAEKIEALGYTVLNPHEICRFIDPKLYETPEAHWEACMRECLAHLPYASALVTLYGWENSKGAKIEVAAARLFGFIEVFSVLTFLTKTEHATA